MRGHGLLSQLVANGLHLGYGLVNVLLPLTERQAGKGLRNHSLRRKARMTGIRGGGKSSGVSTVLFTHHIRFGRRPVTALLELFALLVLLSSAALTAWAGVGGSISGTVRDPSGAVLPHASVTATSTETGIQQTV